LLLLLLPLQVEVTGCQQTTAMLQQQQQMFGGDTTRKQLMDVRSGSRVSVAKLRQPQRRPDFDACQAQTS
jgi:hypothetical protein